MTHAPAARKRAGAPEDDDGDSDSTIPPPDGGWGWVVVWASFMIHIVTDGVTYSFGVLLRQLVMYFNAGEGATSLIMSILVGVTLCSGPIASAFVNKWGCRAVTIAGAIMSGLCLAVSFFATNLATLYVTIGLGTGFGFGLIYLPAIVSVTCYFEKYRSLATGIAVAGSGLGTFIFAPFIEYLIATYGGWRGTVLILSGLTLNTAIMGALFRPIEKPRRSGSLESLDGKKRARQAGTELKELPRDTSELKLLLNGDLKEQQANELTPQQQTQTVVRSAHNIPTAVRDAQATSNNTVPRNVKVLSLNLSATPHQILSGQNHQHHHGGGHHGHHQHSWRHKSDIARLALSQPTLQTTTGSVQHLAGSGVMYRKDIFYRGSLVNIPHYRSSCKLSRHTSTEGLGGLKRASVELESPDSDVQLTVCGCIPCSPETKDTLAEMLDMSLFKDIIFILFTISNFLTSIGFYMPYAYLKAYGEKAAGLDPLNASMLVSVIGIANTIGRLVLGYAADKPWVNRLLVYNLSLTIAGVATVLVVVCHDFWTLAVYASVFGFTIGAYVGLTSVILVDLLGLDKLTNAFGLLLLFQGIASLAGPPIGGWLYDATKSYEPSFWVAGVAMALSGVMLFIVPPIQRRKEAKRRQACKQVVSSPATSNGNSRPQPV